MELSMAINFRMAATIATLYFFSVGNKPIEKYLEGRVASHGIERGHVQCRSDIGLTLGTDCKILSFSLQSGLSSIIFAIRSSTDHE
jgi:hypothetical protein